MCVNIKYNGLFFFGGLILKLFLKDVIYIPFKCAKFEAFIIMIQKILVGLIPMAQIVLVTKFIDSVTKLVGGNGDYSQVIIPITMIGVLTAFNSISSGLVKLASVSLELKIKKKYRTSLVKKIAGLKYFYIENDESQNLISRVSKDIEKTIKDSYVNVLNFISALIKVGGIIVTIFYYSKISAVIIVGVCIPLFYVSVKGGTKIYEVSKEVAKDKRQSDYLAMILIDREVAYEKSLFGFTDNLSDKWFEINKVVIEKEYKANRDFWVNSNKTGVVIIIIASMISLMFIVPLKNGSITIGSFIAIANAMFAIRSYVGWQFANCVSIGTKHYKFYEELRIVLALDEEKDALECADTSIVMKTLEFKNVSFKYDGTENYIFKDLSFKIEEGKHYSIVGANGSGKTTITKLITGLYSNFTGDILINGKSIREYRQSQIKGLTTLVYQDFARYFMSIKNNIEVGNIEKLNYDKFTEKINEAIHLVGLSEKVKSLDNGIDTNLGKIKDDSIDLSGGQWQKIAMARSIVNGASLRILDEPTSALDPISESKVYESFEKISKDKTTVFISHRLGSTKIADVILVLENGILVEQGSHEKLIELEGTYAKMYEGQKEWYAC